MYKHKQFSEEHSSIFQDASVVTAYQYRPPYPAELLNVLAGLMDKTASPRRILDAGCGTGQMASMLLPLADTIDAVDISPAMIEAGKGMPYGSDAKINWIVGEIEWVTLNPPYALVVAAASIHWMAWDITLPLFARLLSPNGHLALVEELPQPNSWDKEIGPILARHSMNRDFQPYTMLTVANELQERGLFEQIGVIETEAVPFRQPLEGWIEAFHARNGFSRERMGEQRAAEFDREIRTTISKYCPSGEIELRLGARIVYGKPLDPAS